MGLWVVARRTATWKEVVAADLVVRIKVALIKETLSFNTPKRSLILFGGPIPTSDCTE